MNLIRVCSFVGLVILMWIGRLMLVFFRLFVYVMIGFVLKVNWVVSVIEVLVVLLNLFF